jgi:hypothetical protein
MRWHRIEPGYYWAEQDGERFELADMRGQSVRWSGADIVDTWEVRRRIDGRMRLVTTVRTYADAKATADRLASGGRK